MLALAGALALSVGAPAVDGAILWRGDFETGNLSQWTGVQCVTDRVTIVTDPVRQGSYAARFEVRPGDDPINSGGERCELRKVTDEAEGTESWWAWSTYFPDSFDPTPGLSWNIYTQWHGTQPTGQPNVSFEASATTDPWQFKLRLNGGDAANPTKRSITYGNIAKNVWYDFVFHVKWSSTDAGFVEVWRNGEKVIDRISTPTLYSGQGAYVKQGFYRAVYLLTSVIVHDGMRRGESCADVGCPDGSQEVEIAPTNDSRPAVSGAAAEGETLRADAGSWSGTRPLSFAYEWERCDADGCRSIAGATAETYEQGTADVGSTLRVVVTARNMAGEATAASEETAPVSPRPPPPATVASVWPLEGAAAVAPATNVDVVFSEAMSISATQSAFRLVRVGTTTPVSGTFSWSGRTMTFNPGSNLAKGQTYTASVSAAAKDSRGNPIASAKTWQFQILRSLTAYPVTTLVETGTLKSGDVTRLRADDNAYFAVSSTTTGTRTTSWYATFPGVANELGNLKVSYKGKNSATCAQTLAVWNWDTSAWTSVSSRSVGTSEVAITAAPPGAPAAYVHGASGPGDLLVRVVCTRAGNFVQSADRLRITYDGP